MLDMIETPEGDTELVMLKVREDKLNLEILHEGVYDNIIIIIIH